MIEVVASLKSISPYSQSRMHDEPKVNFDGTPSPDAKENPDAYERRTWRKKMHVTSDGHVFIPSMVFKNNLSEAAAFLSIKTGKGSETFTKHFQAGVMVTDGLVLPEKAEDVPGEWFFMSSTGTKSKGGGKRVRRCYPMIASWSGDVTYYVIDETITQHVFEHHLKEAGRFIGIGRFRPRNGGFYGRFIVEKIKWGK